MKSSLLILVFVAMATLIGCSGGNNFPHPSETPGWNAVDAYASSIKREAMAIAALAAANPNAANDQASAALENFQDGVDAGQYAETIAKIKEILTAMANGKGKASGLKELAEKLPGDLPGR